MIHQHTIKSSRTKNEKVKTAEWPWVLPNQEDRNWMSWMNGGFVEVDGGHAGAGAGCFDGCCDPCGCYQHVRDAEHDPGVHHGDGLDACGHDVRSGACGLGCGHGGHCGACGCGGLGGQSGVCPGGGDQQVGGRDGCGGRGFSGGHGGHGGRGVCVDCLVHDDLAPWLGRAVIALCLPPAVAKLHSWA